ncbi:MAG: TlpA disulfide reductase family protein [Gammaproteobacteria bacterium]|nr:TlpA disulfide reductase family protein [Gammaproteobacteria bacterium]
MKIKFCIKLGMALLTSLLLTQALAVEEGEMAPQLTLPSIYADRPEISLSALQGKTLYVDFWASWCAPCLLSLPLYNDMYHKYKDQGLEVIAISVDNPVEDGLDFLLDTPLDFLIPSDPEGNAADAFGVIGMPSSYLISPEGEVKLVHMGFSSGDMEIIEAAVVENLPGAME